MGVVGYRHTDEARNKMSLAHRGKKRPDISTRLKGNQYARGYVFNPEQREKLRLSRLNITPEQRQRMSIAHRGRKLTLECREKIRLSKLGEKSHFWRGGISGDHRRRVRPEDIRWRLAVYARDDYMCQCCFKRGGELNAHHIKEFCKHPELRFDVENGLTLCRQCHINLHKKQREI